MVALEREYRCRKAGNGKMRRGFKRSQHRMRRDEGQITLRLFDKASRNHIILYLPVTDMRNILWIFGRVSLQVTLKTIYVIDVALLLLMGRD